MVACRCRLFAALLALAVFLSGGCAQSAPIPGARPDLLDFLRDGQTRREEVLTTLGEPSGSFENERILTWRIGHDVAQGYYVISPKQLQPWQFVSHSLVLVFGDGGVLRIHKLVAVQ